MSVFRRDLGAFAALAALPAALPLAGSVAPAAAQAPTQCMTRLLSPEQMATGMPSQVRCYRTHAEMLSAAGIRSLAADQPLATHYLDANGLGASLTVYGSSCDGGGVNLSGPYDDAISSTRHLLCGRIKHFAEPNAGGDHQITTGGLVNMNANMNDRTSSIYYYAS